MSKPRYEVRDQLGNLLAFGNQIQEVLAQVPVADVDDSTRLKDMWASSWREWVIEVISYNEIALHPQHASNKPTLVTLQTKETTS